MSIIEHHDPHKWLPLEYPEGYRYTVRRGNHAAVFDLRQYTLPKTYDTDAVHWMTGKKYGIHHHIDHEIDWDKLNRAVDKAFLEPSLTSKHREENGYETN